MTFRFWLGGMPLEQAAKEQLAKVVLESVVKHEDKPKANTKD